MLLLLPAGSGRGEKLGTAGDAGGLPAPGGARLVSGSRWYPEPKGGYLGWRSRRGCSGLRRGARCRQAGREGRKERCCSARLPCSIFEIYLFCSPRWLFVFYPPGKLAPKCLGFAEVRLAGPGPVASSPGWETPGYPPGPEAAGNFLPRCRREAPGPSVDPGEPSTPQGWGPPEDPTPASVASSFQALSRLLELIPISGDVERPGPLYPLPPRQALAKQGA